MSVRSAQRAVQAEQGRFRRRRRGVLGGSAAGVAALLVLVGSTSAYAAGLPTGPSATGVTGARPSATRLSFPLSDRTVATVDVGSGNLNLSSTLLQLPGVAGTVPLTVAYNSRDTTLGAPTGTLKGPGKGWTWGLANAGSLSLAPNGTTVDYTTADGAVFPFTQSGGVYTSPAGFKVAFVKTGNVYTMTDLAARTVTNFTPSGEPESVTDRNGNGFFFAAGPNGSTQLLSTAGETAAKKALLAPTAAGSGYTTTLTQAPGGVSRAATLSQASDGSVLKITDPAGAQTTFTYGANGLISQVSGPNGAQNFTYDSTRRVTQVDRSNTSGSGTATTRFSYASATSTLVAGPSTSTSTAVATGAHTTYTLDSNLLVTKAVDPAGRTRSATYTSQGQDVASSTTGTAGGSPASVSTTYGYDTATNRGLSPTSVKGAGGNTSTASYGNTAAATQYLPSKTASDTNVSGGSATTSYTYNGAGNLMGTTGNTAVGSTASSTSVQSTVVRNNDGTIGSATQPGNGSDSTGYGYTNGQLTSVSPVGNSTLRSSSASYDGWGRLKTQTDGAGRTTTYTYDDDDRVLTTAFSDSTPTVTNTWDKAGDLTKQVSAGGTITNTYDQLGQLLTTSNTAGGGGITYGYDKAGNNTSLTDSRGITRQTFDAAGVLTSTAYPKGTTTAPDGGGVASTYFKTDSNGNRTDVWLQGQSATNNVPTDWAARVHTSYAANGRTARITAYQGDPAAEKAAMDVYYCYNSAGSTTSCSTTTTTDASKLQWTYNNLTKQTTKFTYDGLGRLTNVVESGATSGGNSTYTYTYDARGNRLSATTAGSTTSSQTLTYNAANQITSSGYSYDTAGNMTASPNGTYTYNAAEQMTSATMGGTKYTYTYAGASQNAVLSETGNGHTYNAVYGRPDQVGNPTIAQYQVDGKTAYVEQDPATGQATMLHTSSDIAALYIYDGIGSPVALLTDFSTTAFQYKYDPYGLPTLAQNSGGNGVGQNPYAFKSGVQDRATGFVKYGERWYNPVTGTWTQQDTLDAPLDAANANRYAFAGDDPVNGSDPSGRIVGFSCVVGAAFAVGLFGFTVAEIGDIAIAIGALPVSAGTSAVVGAAVAVGIGTELTATFYLFARSLSDCLS